MAISISTAKKIAKESGAILVHGGGNVHEIWVGGTPTGRRVTPSSLKRVSAKEFKAMINSL